MIPTTDNNVLYFLADYEKYRQGKIDVLSSKSSVLICRERIKKIITFREQELEVRNKIVKAANKLKSSIHKYILSLPKTKEPAPRIETPRESRVEVRNRQIKPQDEIKGELAEINRKLAELTGETEENEEFNV